MAFYDFRGGLIDALALQIVPKFQSYEKEITNLNGYLQNGEELHKSLLKYMTKDQWENAAYELTRLLDSSNVTSAVQGYPPEVYSLYGLEHIEIFQARLEKTDSIANYFYSTIH